MFRLCLLIVASSILGLVNCDGFYKVIGPRVVRPNSEFHVSVATQATSLPTTISVAVVGTSLNGRSYNVEDTATVLPYSTSIVRLEIGNINEGNYKLVARGTGGIQFQSSSPLEFMKKSYSVFIQTDKSVYKPGHKVLFRALILNSGLKPAADVRSEPINIFVSDGRGNKVKQWTQVNAPRGVFAEELQLSKNPVLGDWNITVAIRGQTFNKTFQVAEYVVPKFMISIDAPKHITFQENILTANIQAQYSYGKKVKGDATITVYPTYYSGVIQPIFQNPVRKVIPIDGSITVNFDIAKELKLSDEYERTVIIDVTIEELPTGRKQNNSMEVQIHKYDYKMSVIKTADYFKPGMPYTAYIKVKNHDGTPVMNERRSVTINYGFSREDEIYTKDKIVLDRNGLYKLVLDTPPIVNKLAALRIEAEYYDLKERLPPVPAAVSLSNNFLQVTLETERNIVNSDISVFINSTESMKYLTYELIGRGDVIIANTFKIDNMKDYRFHFTATHAMVPLCHLLVSYIRNDGELIADAIDIEVDGLFQNFIEIQANAVETSPETDIDLTIRAQPNSYIGLMAIDEQVSKLKSGHDLTMDLVASELNAYDSSYVSPYSDLMKGAKNGFAWRQGASNSRDMFFESGTTLITNSLASTRRPTLEDIYLRPVFYDGSTVKPDRGLGLHFHTATRPPLAGPYAFSRIPRPVWNKPKVYLTENLMDTWLFTNFSSGFEGKTAIRRRIPNSLNTWTITGFSLNPLHGLGLLTNPKKIKVSKPFAVFMDLPHAIKQGEILSIPVVVYNYMDKDIEAEVTLYNPEQKFAFAQISNEVNGTVTKVELYRRRRVSVKKYSGSSVSFMISPYNLGLIEIKASASSESNQDSTIKHLNVKADGETLHFTKTILVDLTKRSSYKGNVTFEIPKNVVPNSENFEVSAVGDFLGPTIMNLDHLIRLPTASGEQNLIHFVPNLIILKYLQNTRQLTPTIQLEAVKRLEMSYQQQLTYRKMDGSFTIFGKENENGSVWLTAYTAMSLTQAKPYVFVESNIINTAYEWLASMQSPNGSFIEQSPIIHKDVQSNDDNSLALTAFVILAFIENEIPISRHSNVINKGLDYVARNLDEKDSQYTVAICSYLLQVANHPSKLSAFNLLDSKAQTRDQMKWWGNSVRKNETKNPWNSRPKSLDIEATAYGLLTFIEANLLEDAMPVLHWLVGQENNLGGFASTQDTKIGLYALYRMITKLSSNTNMQIEFAYRKQETSRFSINRDNAMIVQKFKIGNQARQVNISATGSGFALFRVSYDYNMNVTGPWPLFTLDPQVDKNSNRFHLQLSICTAFVSQNLTDTPESNMAVMEVNFPSGFTADVDALPSLEVSQNVQKVETKNDDTTVILYFNNLTIIENCQTVSAFQTSKVAKQKPVHVIIYDYYDSSRRARIFYRGRRSTTCDICEGEDCGIICTVEAEKQRAEESKEEGKGGCSSASPAWVALLLIFINIFNR